MDKTLYAINAQGHRVARIVLVEGATFVDAELYVLRGNVAGASRVSPMDDPAQTMLETERRIDDAARSIGGLPFLPAPEPVERAAHAPGSIAESEARIEAALDGLDDRSAKPAPPTPYLPVISVAPVKPRTDLAPIGGLRIGESSRNVGPRLAGPLKPVELSEGHGLMGAIVTTKVKATR